MSDECYSVIVPGMPTLYRKWLTKEKAEKIRKEYWNVGYAGVAVVADGTNDGFGSGFYADNQD